MIILVVLLTSVARADQRNVPIILSSRAQNALPARAVYVSPELDDAIARSRDIHHEEVRGVILMPRLRYLIDDDCEDDDYADYAGLKKTRHKSVIFGEMRPRTLRVPFRGRSEYDPNLAPLTDARDPTIEEMVPYTKIAHTPDTYILMTDDPVLIVDANVACGANNATAQTFSTTSAETTTTVAPSLGA